MKKERLLSLLAGVALVLGFFLPWISFFGMSMSGMTLVQGSFESGKALGGIIMALLPLGGIGLLAYALMPSENRTLRMASNILVVAVFLYVVFSIVADMGKESGGLGQVMQIMSIGFYLTIAGILLSIVDLIMAFTSKPKSNEG